MPEKKIVTNTGPIIALVAALGNLDILKELYKRVIVSYEVSQEILTGGPDGFAVKEFQDAAWMDMRDEPLDIYTSLIEQPRFRRGQRDPVGA